jgi:hypothetical protein
MAPMWIRPADGALVARNAQRAWTMETTLAAPRTWHTEVRLRPKVESKSSRFPISDAARTPLVGWEVQRAAWSGGLRTSVRLADTS